MFKTFLDVLREKRHSKFSMSNKGFEMGADIAKHLLAGVRECLLTWTHLNNLWPIADKKLRRKRQAYKQIVSTNNKKNHQTPKQNMMIGLSRRKRHKWMDDMWCYWPVYLLKKHTAPRTHVLQLTPDLGGKKLFVEIHKMKVVTLRLDRASGGHLVQFLCSRKTYSHFPRTLSGWILISLRKETSQHPWAICSVISHLHREQVFLHA